MELSQNQGKLEVIIEVVVEVRYGGCNQSWSWSPNEWSDKSKSILISTQVDVVVEVEIELDNL